MNWLLKLFAPKKSPEPLKVGDCRQTDSDSEFYAVVTDMKDGWVEYYVQSCSPFEDHRVQLGLSKRRKSMPEERFLRVYSESR